MNEMCSCQSQESTVCHIYFMYFCDIYMESCAYFTFYITPPANITNMFGNGLNMFEEVKA
jgi:hypothetical protein